MKILRHLQAILLLPLMVTGVIPWLLLAGGAGINVGWALAPPLNLVPVTAGGLLIGLGLILIVYTVRLFFQYGEGTLARGRRSSTWWYAASTATYATR